MKPFVAIKPSLALSALVVSLGGCATLSDPPHAPAPLSSAEAAGQPGVPYSDVIAPTGSPRLASGSVERGESLLSFGYAYRHTAVLTEDVVGYSITVPGVQAPAGSPGYYAGTFSAEVGISQSLSRAELWCFMPGVVGGTRNHLCFLRNQPGLAAIAPTRLNPFLWDNFAAATGTFDYVRTPIYDRRPVEIPGDLRIEYVFEGWTQRGVRLTEKAAGRDVRTFELARQADGTARLPTVVGVLLITPDAASPERASARLI